MTDKAETTPDAAAREALLLLMRFVEDLEGGLASQRGLHSPLASRLAELREILGDRARA